MPSPPSPRTDHFAAVEEAVKADKRLTEAQVRLLVRSVRRGRADYGGSPDLLQMLVTAWLRAYWQLIAAPPNAVTTIRSVDALTRLSGRLGLLRSSGPHGVGRPKSGRSSRSMKIPPARPMEPRQDD